MPSVYDIKPAFQKLLRPVSNGLFKAGISPNQITISATVLSIITGALIYKYHSCSKIFFILPIWLFIRMAMNAIDGMLAREHNMQTVLGTFLNELGDVVSDCVLYIPFAIIPNIHSPLILCITILLCLSEITGIVAIEAGSTRRYEGPMGKSDRALAFSIIAILLAFGITSGLLINGLLWVIIAGLIITIINRAAKAIREAI